MKKILKKIKNDFINHKIKIKHYQYREKQVELAHKIAVCLFDETKQKLLLAESETGTGKTLAYLIPVLRSKQRILISTHTRTLQDQLMFRDLPVLQQALGLSRSTALLKGRLNYLCPKRLEENLQSHRLSSKHRVDLMKVQQWAGDSLDGDLNALPFDVGQKGVRGMITATAEQCLGSQCDLWHRCPLMIAREKAKEADIVISNHSLLLTDAALKSSGQGELIPDFDAYILDEAHHLPKLASRLFGLQVSYQRLIQWHQNTQESLDELADEIQFKHELKIYFLDFMSHWGNISLVDLMKNWSELPKFLQSREKRGELIRQCYEQALRIQNDMAFIIQPDDYHVAWYEGEGEYLRYLAAPVDSGEVLKKHVWHKDANFVLLSATFRISDCFDYAKMNLGMQDAQTCHYTSPFDYASQALIYIPNKVFALSDEIITLLHASQGRAFVLFTSHHVLKRVAPILRKSIPWPILEQGGGKSKLSILKEFQEDTSSILCGTRGFWEGIDMPGKTLSMVIMDKLPFSPPSDPLLQARISLCETMGGHGFRDIQLPETIAVLKQGAGRLIRSMNDRGVIALLDSRVHQRAYGADIIKNLPPARMTKNINDVTKFFL